MTKTLIFRRDLFADRIKTILQKLESEADTKLKSLMTAEAKSKVEGIDTISKKFHDVVKVTPNDGDFPEEIYTAVMKRVVAVEAPKISGGVFNQGAIIQQLGTYIADLLDTKSETINVGKTTYILSNPIGSTVPVVTVTIKGNENVKYTFSWNDTDKAKKSLNSYMESLQEFEKEQLLAVFFALLKDAKKASGVLKDLSSLWSKGLLSGKALDYASKMNGFEFFRVLSTYKKLYGESVFTLITGVVEEIKPLLEIYANTQTPNKKVKKLLDWYSKATGTVEGFIEWTVEIFDDNKKAIKNITKKYNDLLEKSFKLAETVTNYVGSDESLISALDKKSSTYQNFVTAYNALETELGQSNTSFDSMLENYTTYSITDAHKETVTTNNALLKSTNENDTLNIQSHDVKVYGGEGDDDFIASGRNITLIGEQGKDHFLLRDVTSKNYVDAGVDDDTILSYGNNNTINGGSGNDSIFVSVYEGFGIKNEIRGGEGDDTISVTAVIENTVLGEAGNDFIQISEEANNNTILGGKGNDTITIDDVARNFIGYSTGDGNDTVLGFNSNDTLYIAEGDFSKSTIGADVMVNVGDGSILLKDAAGKDSNVKKPLTFDDLFKDMQRNKVIFGTQQDDTLSTTGDGATVDAGDGNDLIYNYVGANAYIDGGEGNDSVQSNIDGITIDGGAGADSIRNYAGDGIIFGGADNDSVYNSGSNIEINGGNGDDYIENRRHAVTIAGDEGSDSIFNTVNFVTIDAGSDNDSVQNSGSSASINGGSGDDSILSHGPNVSIIGGTGNDFISLASVFISHSYSPDNLIVYNLRDGNDSIVGFSSAWTLQLISGAVDKIDSDAKDVFMAIGNDTITLTDSFRLGSLSIVDENEDKITLPVIEINGSEEKDSFSNRWDNAIIKGLADNDSIENSGSNVSIDGGTGDDTIYNGDNYNKPQNISINTGDGNDYIGNSGSNVSINAGAGTNRIYSSGDTVSILSGESDDSINNYGDFVTIDGGLGDNSVYSSGNNVSITAGIGNDTITNNGSNVTINASAGDDYIYNKWSSGKNVLLVYNASDGNDFISGFRATSTLQLISSTVDKISSDAENIFLAIGNDTITLSGAFDLGSINVVDEDGSKIELPGLEINATEEIEFIGNSWNNATINGVTNNDSIRINNRGSNILINVEAGNDSVQNDGEFVTISSGAGDDSILNWSGGNNASISGEFGNDYIENYGNEFVTISGGAGNDDLTNRGSNVSIVGGAGNDSIENIYGFNVTIRGDDGSDTIHNWSKGNNASISGGSNDDTIFNSAAHVTIDGGLGDDFIGNFGASSVIDGGEGNDFINISGDNISVSGSKGNDTITNGEFNKPYRRDGTSQKYLGGGKVIFQYSEGDGNDLVEGFNALSTLSISGGSYSTQVSDFDIIVKVGEGSITLSDVYNFDNLNIIGTLAETDDTTDDSVDDTADDSLDDTEDDSTDDTADDSLDDTEDDSTDDTADDSLDDTEDDSLDDTEDDSTDDTADDSTDDVINDKLKEPEFIIKEDKKFVDASKRTKAIKIIGNTLDNSIVGGRGNDTLDSADGDDTLTGGKGSDLFIFSGGKNVITDYEIKDKIITGDELSYAGFEVEGDDVILNFGENNSLTIKDGVNKKINMNSTVNFYTADGILDKNKKAITLASDAENFTASSNLKTVDGSATDAIEILGNNKANSIVAGASGSILNGGRGRDTLQGGDGADIFVYANKSGKDVVENYGAGDKISLDSDVTIKDVKIKKGNVIMKFKGGSLTINDTTTFTLTDDGNETIFSGGMFLVSDSLKVLGNFKGTIDLTEDLNNVDASLAKKKFTINGNDANNYLVGGKGKDCLIGGAGNDTLWGGKKNDTLLGGDGDDTFIFQAGNGKDTILDYASGELLQILDKRDNAGDFKEATFKDDTLTLAIQGGGKVILKNVSSSIDFNINGEIYHIEENSLAK